eukprot:CAMPEP_0198199876 /NCGR_PEP_ID=MMETSP1445-20131203/3001_1 /TAXON_ID=36898 /ORGANISM="Pyramimonas sp., Strain CCMP2087" /LENGTH=235 /DNA_ID=CAMNT_0043869781 /DNA_START=77 /DNA_END=781 /DNA_ORIENTATION=-
MQAYVNSARPGTAIRNSLDKKDRTETFACHRGGRARHDASTMGSNICMRGNTAKLQRLSVGTFRGTVHRRTMRVKADAIFSQPDAPSPRNPRVCILGGGFGGLYTALRLNSLPWPQGTEPEVTLVDMNDNFVFKPLLYELLNGGAEPHEVAPTFQDLLAGTKVTFRKAAVESIEPRAEGATEPGLVTLKGGDTLEYDWLVLALGAQTKLALVPGVREHALPFSTLEDAMEVDMQL